MDNQKNAFLSFPFFCSCSPFSKIYILCINVQVSATKTPEKKQTMRNNYVLINSYKNLSKGTYTYIYNAKKTVRWWWSYNTFLILNVWVPIFLKKLNYLNLILYFSLPIFIFMFAKEFESCLMYNTSVKIFQSIEWFNTHWYSDTGNILNVCLNVCKDVGMLK